MRFLTVVTRSGLHLNVPSFWSAFSFHGVVYRIVNRRLVRASKERV